MSISGISEQMHIDLSAILYSNDYSVITFEIMALHLCRLDSFHFIRKSSAQNCVQTVNCSKTLLNPKWCGLVSLLFWSYATFLSFWKHSKSNSEYLSFMLDSRRTFQGHVREAGQWHIVVLVAYGVPAHGDLWWDQCLEMNLDLVKVGTFTCHMLFTRMFCSPKSPPCFGFCFALRFLGIWTEMDRRIMAIL